MTINPIIQCVIPLLLSFGKWPYKHIVSQTEKQTIRVDRPEPNYQEIWKAAGTNNTTGTETREAKKQCRQVSWRPEIQTGRKGRLLTRKKRTAGEKTRKTGRQACRQDRKTERTGTKPVDKKERQACGQERQTGRTGRQPVDKKYRKEGPEGRALDKRDWQERLDDRSVDNKDNRKDRTTSL